MNSSDFLIIYFTCGTPLGVLYFLQNFKKQNDIQIWFKTFFTFVFWLPFGFQLLLKLKLNKKDFGKQEIFYQNTKTENGILFFQKQFEEVLQRSNLQISIFEFREILERYVGLTIAEFYEDERLPEPEKEVFCVSDTRSIEIGTICLNRRNAKRLLFHQIRARQDFLQIINQLITFASDRKEFVKAVGVFFLYLNDPEAQSHFEKSSASKSQNQQFFADGSSENYLWNTQKEKLQTLKSVPLQLQNLTVTASSSVKD